MKMIIYFIISVSLALSMTHLISPDYNNQFRHTQQSERVK